MNSNLFYCFYSLLILSGSAAADNIELLPITLGEGESYSSFRNFPKDFEAAKRADIDLFAELDKFIVQGYHNRNAFVLFYNFVQAAACNRHYVIQTVKLTKKFYDQNGDIHHEKNEYLVEAMKLDKKKLTKKPDQHLKRYSLGNAHRRDLLATYEVGCGRIPGIVDGNPWPFKRTGSYHRIQDYSKSIGLYSQVKFDFSITYTLGISFDADGTFTVQVPDFLAKKDHL